jgi:hypothetical protein
LLNNKNVPYSLYQLGVEPRELKLQMVFYFKKETYCLPLVGMDLMNLNSFHDDYGKIENHLSIVHSDVKPTGILDNFPLITPVYNMEFNYSEGLYN